MEAASSDIRARTVLVVDDERVVRLMVSRFMTRVGWSVLEAESAEQAVAMLNGTAVPDLVICDLNLPGQSGAGLCRHIAEHHPSLASRVVLTSGDPASAARELQRAELGCPILGKPFALADLEHVVASVVGDG